MPPRPRSATIRYRPASTEPGTNRAAPSLAAAGRASDDADGPSGLWRRVGVEERSSPPPHAGQKRASGGTGDEQAPQDVTASIYQIRSSIGRYSRRGAPV